MNNSLDLAQFGLSNSFEYRGTIKSHRVASKSPPLFLFGERHSIKPYILNNLMNALHLEKLGAISCVGVEGNWKTDSLNSILELLLAQFREKECTDNEVMASEMLAALRGRDMHFQKILALLSSNLPIESVEDLKLHSEAAKLELVYQERTDYIWKVLRDSPLFETSGDASEREEKIHKKTELQYEYEFAEEPIHHQRDAAFISNMLDLWERSGRNKGAVLNLGSSHQYRIARILPADINYIHIEQP